jgi:DNA replication protein DnaC
MAELSAKRAGEIVAKEKLPEQEYNCPVHGKYMGSPVKFLSRIWDVQCPECDREIVEKNAREEQEADECRRAAAEARAREERENYLSEMNIGEKFWNESFDTFSAYTPGLKRHLEICIAYANDPQGRMLLMIGKNGNGKNHLAASILQKTGGYALSVLELELILKDCYSRKAGELEFYQRLCKVPMLVINEIGKHKAGDWETNFLSYIINKRYENLMPTVLVTNTHLRADCPEKGCPNCFQNYLGNDVLSRIVEDGEIMVFNEKDYRYKKREMRGNQKDY